MKKLGLLVMPLMTMSLLMSCNNQVSYTVNEQEMIDALTMKNVKYIQCDVETNDAVEHKNQVYELAPERCHHIEYNSTLGNYLEEYLIKVDDTLKKWARYAKDDEFIEKIPEKGDKILTPQDLSDDLISVLVDKTYNDFEYHDDTKEYFIEFYDAYCEADFTAAVKFSNKKAIAVTSWLKSGQRKDFYMSISFKYKKLTPKPPVK